MAKVLSEKEVVDIRKRMDGPPEPSYLSLSQPFDSSPDDAWCSACEDLDHLLRSHEELRRRLGAAITRLSAEADCLAYEYDYEKWLTDIIRDLSLEATVANLVKSALAEDASRDESKT